VKTIPEGSDKNLKHGPRIKSGVTESASLREFR